MKDPLSRRDNGPVAVSGPALAEAAGPAPARSLPATGWYRRPAVQGLIALAAYVAAWLLTVGRPLLHNLGDAHLDQLSMDPNFYTWCLRWWPFALGHGLNPLFSHLIGAPHGHSLAWVTTIPPIALVASPLTLAFGPIVTFNLLTALGLPVAAWAAFVLCRRLTGKFWPALVGGAVFGFSAYEMNHLAAGQLNLTYSLLLPLLGYLVVLWRQRAISGRAFVILAGLTMAVQFYLFLETFADMTAILAVALLVGLAVADPAHRPEVRRLAKYLGAAYAIGIFLALPYLAYALTSRAPVLHADTSQDLLSFIVPRRDRTNGIAWLHRLAVGPIPVSEAGYIGIPLLVVAAILVVTCWRSRLVRFLACMLAFVVIAALGPVLYVGGRPVLTFPWAPLWQLPFVRNAYPSRLMLFAYLALAVMTALWLAGTAAKVRPAAYWLRAPLALLVVFALYQDAIAMDVNPHSTVPTYISAGTYRHDLSRGETVVVVSEIGNAGMLWQAETGFYVRLAGGYINQAITRRTDLPRVVQRLANATPARVLSFERYARQDRIGAILLDRNHAPKWVGIFWRMGLKGYTSGNVVVYPVNACRLCHPLTWPQIHH